MEKSKLNFWAILFCGLIAMDLIANCIVIFKKNKIKSNENKGEEDNV